ncbi:hypothetical protein GCM10009565_37170 [Amycolatopsis albidoflavus]
MRSRYLYLIDTARLGVDAAPFAEDMWDRALVAETEIDDAVRSGTLDQASQLCAELMDGSGHDAVTVVNARVGLGDVARVQGRTERAIDHYEAAVRAADAARYRFGRLRALVPLGHLTLLHHSAAAATRVFTEAADLAAAVSEPLYLANAITGLAETAERSGDLPQSIEKHQRAHALFSQVGSLTGQAHAAQRIGSLLHRDGRPALARDWLAAAALAFEQDGDPLGTINVLEAIGDLLLEVAEADEAATCYRTAGELARENGFAPAAAHAAQNLARVACACEQWPEAVALFEQAVSEYQKVGDLLGTTTALTKLASARQRLDGPEAGEQALADRVAAVLSIEHYRATNREARAQVEYRERFGEIYGRALHAAVESGAAEDFAVVAEALAGRRLAGLAEAQVPATVTDGLTLLQHFLVSAEQRWLAQGRAEDTGDLRLKPGISRQERVHRMMGAVAMKGAVREPARAALEDVLASVYLPPAADEGSALLADLPSDCDVLQLVVDPVLPNVLYRLWRAADGRTRLDRAELSLACVETLTALQIDDARRSDMCPAHVACLGELLPEDLRRAMAEGTACRLLLLPVGQLWLVPWGALAIGGQRLLCQTTEYVVCPSLLVQRRLRARGPARPVDEPTCTWRNPIMDSLSLEWMRQDSQWSVEPASWATEAKQRLTDGAHTVIVVCHGRPHGTLGHYLEMDPGVWLLPSDVLVGTPPQRLYLITCWGGGVPGQAMADPVTIATLNLARGSTEILASFGEFSDDPASDAFAQWVLEQLANTNVPVSRAVHLASARFSTAPGGNDLQLRYWATLLPIGTFHDV